MRPKVMVCAGVAAVVFLLGGIAIAQHESHATTAGLSVPPSIHAEHEEIMAGLAEAVKAPGEVGRAAKALEQVLRPHFEREEQIALPPLGLLAPLARGEKPGAADEVVTMTGTLRKEMPKMLDQHKEIRARVERLQGAAHVAKAARQEAFAETLARHAATEEEVLYPAAMLVGDLVKQRISAK